jgi:UDP-glucose 4-epimerase
MSVLITGGAGFIGSHLAEHLLERGEKVYVVDDLSTGSMENISHLVDHPNFFYEIDTIMNDRLMERLIQRVDMIYHLAAAVGVKLIVEEPIKCITTNILGTAQVLHLAYELGKKKVLISSTSEIYGKSNATPFKEEDDRLLGPTTKLRWSYSTSKAVDEYLGLNYFMKKGLPVIIARLFNTVGPRQTGRYGMVIPRFVKQALTSQPITVYGDGNQRRCFTNVKDVVEALIELSLHPKAVGEIFNMGSTEDISIKNLALKVKELTGSDSPIIHIPYEEAYEEGFEDMLNRTPDISKIKNLIHFNPKLSLDETLLGIIQYFKDNAKALEKEIQ